MNTRPIVAILAIAVTTTGLAQGRHQSDRRMSVIDESTISRTLHFASGSERLLDVRTINGFIHVTGGDGADVQLDVRKLIRAETEADLSDAQRNVRLEIGERTRGSKRSFATRETRSAASRRTIAPSGSGPGMR